MIENTLEYLKDNLFGNSYARMILAAGIIVFTILLKILFSKILNRFINRSAKEVRNDPTNYKFLKHAISALIYIVGFSAAIYTVPALRTLANSMLAGAGILAVAIGFASQQVFSNMISGVFIIIFKPFRVSDRIQLRGETVTGIIEDITLRHTIMRNFENKRIIIPNSVISQEILVNSDIVEEKKCKIMDLGISYDSDIKRARAIIQDEAQKHPNFFDNRTEEEKSKGESPVAVRVTAWLEFSINLRVWIWAKDAPSAFRMGCDLFESIKERFEKEGIEIPYPHRTLVYKNPSEADSKGKV